MNFAEQIRALLMLATSGPTPVVRVEWHAGVDESPMDEARPAYLSVKQVGFGPEFRAYERLGLDALLEVLGMTRDEYSARRANKSGTPEFTVMRKDDELVLTEMR